jgi:hypothetical protein
MKKNGVKNFFMWAYGLEGIYKRECIFNAMPLILEMHVFKWFF